MYIVNKNIFFNFKIQCRLLIRNKYVIEKKKVLEIKLEHFYTLTFHQVVLLTSCVLLKQREHFVLMFYEKQHQLKLYIQRARK